jgi:hypothetical protein
MMTGKMGGGTTSMGTRITSGTLIGRPIAAMITEKDMMMRGERMSGDRSGEKRKQSASGLRNADEKSGDGKSSLRQNDSRTPGKRGENET